MTDYISREAAIAETRKPRLTDAELRRRLAHIPAADVRPVVFCRDCEYYQADCGWCGWFDIGMNVKDFCSWGKRGRKADVCD